jgi:signal transduction histidine kinase
MSSSNQPGDHTERGSLLLRLQRWSLEHFTSKGAEPDRSYRIRVLFAYSGTAFVTAIAWGTGHLLDGSLITASAFFCTAALIVGIFVKLWRDRRLRFASHAAMALATFTTILSLFLTGGLRMTNVAPFFILIVASIFLLGRQGIAYALLAIGTALTFQVGHWVGFSFPDHIPVERRGVDAFVTWFVSAALVFLLVLVYERARTMTVQELRKANRARSQFLANISHEIRTPIHVIMGVNSLLEKSKLDEEQREHVRTSQQHSETLLALISDLLDMTSMEHGSFALKEMDFDPVDVFESVSRVMRQRCEDKGLGFAMVTRPGVPRSVRGDRNRLHQVLMNIAGNAVKYTESGSVAIEAGPMDAEHGFRVVIRDTGIGIEEKDVEHIFESFTQADGTLARRHEGAGLGLFISSELVRLMGGRIELASAPDEGSTFTLEIPFQPPMSTPASSQEKAA